MLISSCQEQINSQLQIKKMPSVTLSTDQNLKKYYEMRNKLSLPLKIKLYFTILEASLQSQNLNSLNPQNQNFATQFHAVFHTLSNAEKASFLYSNLNAIKNQFQNVYNGFTSSSQSLLGDLNVHAQMSQTLIGLNYWTSVKFSFKYTEKKARVEKKNKTVEIDLRSYLVRKSKKYKNTLVFQATSDNVSSDQRKVYCSFKSNIFDEVYNTLFACILQFRNDQLIRIEGDKGFLKQSLSKISVVQQNKNAYSIRFLETKLLNDYILFKQKTNKRLNSSSMQFADVYQDKKVLIQKSVQYPEMYMMSSIFQCPPAVLKKQLKKQYLSQSYCYLLRSQTLQKTDIYSAIYQKHMLKAPEGSILITQHIMIEQLNWQKDQQIIFLKSINNVMTKKLIDFISIRVKKHQTHHNKSKLIVYGGFNMSKNTNKKQGLFGGLWKKIKKDKMKISFEQNQVIIKILLQFSQMLFREEEAEHLSKLLVGLEIGGFGICLKQENRQESDNESFKTVEGMSGMHNYQQLTLQVQSEENKCDIDNQMDSDHSTQMGEVNQADTYLKNKYQLQPKKDTGDKEVVKKHFIFSQWNRKSKGGITCIDEKPINEQKKVAKFLVKSMGKNILESKGIFNVSLPVTIFKPQSHLQSVARTFGFAPLLLEKTIKMDPVQRIKMVILYSISVSIFSISVSKPFNPILGETHQTWIDGCPAYLEQVSHHPPIVSYLFLGRGYKAHGFIGPKATFGFNTIYGYSQEPNYVEFDDGTKIQVNFGKMAIKGIMFGDRQFNFAQKMFAFDPKNRLFSELTFGEQKKMFSSSSEPEDYFSGRIVQVEQSFINSFSKSEKPIYPDKNNIQRTASTYEGIWNGKIKFDGVEYMDFGKQNPCVMKDEEFPLPSDSVFRPDINFLKQGNTQESQISKQKLQEIQRKDRKMRQKMKS